MTERPYNTLYYLHYRQVNCLTQFLQQKRTGSNFVGWAGLCYRSSTALELAKLRRIPRKLLIFIAGDEISNAKGSATIKSRQEIVELITLEQWPGEDNCVCISLKLCKVCLKVAAEEDIGTQEAREVKCAMEGYPYCKKHTMKLQHFSRS